jgi:acetolactate synthase-1/2/3 large subunit
MERRMDSYCSGDWEGWRARIASLRSDWPDLKELSGCSGINPNALMHELSALGDPAVVLADVGNHQMWAAQSYRIQEGQAFMTSGGMGAMGFALPAAVGAAFHLERRRPVLLIAGDGGFQLSLHELQTVVRNRLPIKMVIVNNRCHGMTRQFQDSYFERRYQGTVWGYDAPDFERVARGFGIEADSLSEPADMADALRRLWQDPLQPYLLQVMVGTFTNVFPKIAFGKPMSEMEPQAKPIEMEST